MRGPGPTDHVFLYRNQPLSKDLIHGNEGEDEIHGGAGVDTLYGEQDDDLIFGSHRSHGHFLAKGLDPLQPHHRVVSATPITRWTT